MKNRIALVPFCLLLGLLVALQGCNYTSLKTSKPTVSSEENLQTSVAGTVEAARTQVPPTAEQSPAQATQPEPPPALETAPPIQTELVAPATEPPAQTELVAPATVPPVQPPPPSGDLSATQTALAPIQASLATLGVDPSQGSLGWIQPPLHLEIDQYRGQKFDNKFPTVIAQDFAMSSDFTWDTEYGGSGCALVFRSNGDQASPSQYMVAASRLASGHVFFAVMAQGQLMIVKDFYAHGVDPLFNATNGATNRLAVVGRGLNFSVYSNGTKLGDVNPTAPLAPLKLPDPPVKPLNLNDQAAMQTYKQAMAQYNKDVAPLKAEYNQRVALWNKLPKSFPSGFTALGAVADSGRTVCDFNNAWLWLIGEQPAMPPQGTVPAGFQGTIPPEYLATLTAQAQAQGTTAP